MVTSETATPDFSGAVSVGGLETPYRADGGQTESAGTATLSAYPPNRIKSSAAREVFRGFPVLSEPHNKPLDDEQIRATLTPLRPGR